jgi:ribosomal protein S18 acetylase RimI-like enzyme
MQSVDAVSLLPESRRVASLSRRLWNLDWNAVLPWKFEDVTVEIGAFGDALPFIEEHYARIFGADENQGRFLASPMTAAKRRFCDEADVFLFRASGQTIGIFLSHPSDWSTYYMRTAALLPEYRGRGLVSRLMENLCAPLRAVGVERLEGDVSPSNTPMMKLHVGQGFQVTATLATERWGTLVHFTRFLSEEAGGVFHRQFCGHPKNRSANRGPHLHQSTERRTS